MSDESSIGVKYSEATLGKIYFGRVEKGKDLLKALTEFVKKMGIKSGMISVVGALKKIKIGYFDTDKKDYNYVQQERLYELMGVGNISYKESDSGSEPYIHLHVSVGDECETYTGHLLEGNIVDPTAEFIIIEFNEEVKRRFDKDTGLYLLNFDKEI